MYTYDPGSRFGDPPPPPWYPPPPPPRVSNKAAVTRTAFPDRPDPCDSWPIAALFQLPQSDNCHKDRAHTVNKAIIVSRHVGRRYPTTNQRNTKMIVIMTIMIIVIIINIIMSMGLPNTPSRSKHAAGNHPTHTTPQGGQGGEPPNHTTPQGGGKQPTTTPHHTTPHHTRPQGGREATHNRTTPRGGGGGTIGGGRGGGPAEQGSKQKKIFLFCGLGGFGRMLISP